MDVDIDVRCITGNGMLSSFMSSCILFLLITWRATETRKRKYTFFVSEVVYDK